MGARALRNIIEQPLVDRESIIRRQDAIEELNNKNIDREELREYLNPVYDLERIMAKIIHLNSNNYEINILILTPLLAFFVFVICVVVDRLISKSKILGSLLFGKK